MIELLVLNTSLNPRDSFKSFNIEDICELGNRFYPMDFTEQEKLYLKYQLENYKLDIFKLLEFKELKIIYELCQVLIKIGKSTSYSLINRLTILC